MGSKKKTKTTNTYAYKKPPTNQYTEKAASTLENVDYQGAVHDAYGRAENEVMESGNEFFGAETTPEERSKIQQAKLFRLKTQKGRDIQTAIAGENALKTGGYMNLGAATRAQLVQTGGETVQTQPMNWGQLAFGGVNAASGARTAF